MKKKDFNEKLYKARTAAEELAEEIENYEMTGVTWAELFVSAADEYFAPKPEKCAVDLMALKAFASMMKNHPFTSDSDEVEDEDLTNFKYEIEGNCGLYIMEHLRRINDDSYSEELVTQLHQSLYDVFALYYR